jgi:prepilin-type N-terminal cleavage/methylation domain-containing protein
VAVLNPQSAIRNPQSQRRGFTLVEMVVSLGIASVLMLGMGAAMLVAARAMPAAGNPTATIVDAGAALEQVLTDLQYAIDVKSRSATMVEFTVADRDGNDIPETIRYEWSGVAGDPLTRRYNGGAAVQALADMREFAFSWDLVTASTTVPQGNESAETILRSYDATIDLANYPIKSSEWYGQYFRPALPPDAVSWKVTRVRLYARTDGAAAGDCRVQLQQATTGKLPSGTVIEGRPLLESALLNGYREQEFAFTLASGLSPTEGLCLVVKWVADASACQLQGVNANGSTSDSFLVKSSDKGVSWSAPTGASLLYTVYGTVTTTGQPQVQNTYYLNRVTIRLRAGTDTQTTLRSAVRLLNKPEVTQ